MFLVQFETNLHSCSLCGVLYNPFYFMLYCLFVAIGIQIFDLIWRDAVTVTFNAGERLGLESTYIV